MHELYEIKDKLMKELEEYGSKEMSPGSLEVIDKLAHSIKNICKIMESAEDEEYSIRGGSYRSSYERGGNRNAYEGGRGGSYVRGRGRNTRRDSMGRYSGMDGYSRADSMEELVESVREMMQELPQNVQQDAQRFVQKLEQSM